MTTRTERTIVVLEQERAELGNDTKLRAEVDTGSSMVSLRYSSSETIASLTFPASATAALAEFFAALVQDEAIVAALPAAQ